jgi:hypothetical protein
MSRIFYSGVLIVVVGIAIAGYSFWRGDQKKSLKVCTERINNFTLPDNEVDSRVVVTSDTGVIFSKSTGDFFRLYKYKNEKIVPVDSSRRDILSPFLVKESPVGLFDRDGDENFKSTDADLTRYTSDKIIQKVYSFNNGWHLFYKLKNEDTLYWVDLNQSKEKAVIMGINQLHSVVLSPNLNVMCVSYDDKLRCIDLIKDKEVELCSLPWGEKLNPFITASDLYFVSNFESEFYRIYKLNLTNPLQKFELVYQSSHDLRMPKISRGYLYCVEVVNSEYLLKKVNLKNNMITSITSKGVVYDYDFFGVDKIAFTYSDIQTPRSITVYSLSKANIINTVGAPTQHSVSLNFIEKTSSQSPAYVLRPPGNVGNRGVILFFHPGLNDDFSPRWDSILMNLCLQGFIIIAPNYPMSSGYGKQFNNANFLDAVNDMKTWKNFILKKYDLPLYFLSQSSGSVLMEALLATSDSGVFAAASLFGLYRYKTIAKTSVPTLFVLGENDPVVNFKVRYAQLRNNSVSPEFIKSYSDEGHWFRKNRNIQHVLTVLMNHFCDN